MQWSDLPLSPPPRTVRQFAGLWLLFLTGLGAWQYAMRDRPTVGMILAAVGIAGGLVGLAWPRVFRPVFVAAIVATFPIGWVVSQLLLAILYYGLFTPLAIAFRLLGRDALCLRRPVNVTTHWQPKPAASDVRAYFHQY